MESIRIEHFAYLPQAAKEIRQNVFVSEQGFKEEFDDTDTVATHFVMFDANDLPFATCRIFTGEAPGVYTLGRLAVLKAYRGQNYGRMLLQAVEKYLCENGGAEVRIHAQVHAVRFYEKCGYSIKGKIDYDENHPHIWLNKFLRGEPEEKGSSKIAAKPGISQAMAFIILFGIVSLFSDMTHEGASSIRGAYLSLIGASATVIGFISGLGELIGCSLRYISGKLTDKTRCYWAIVIIGYTVDLLAVPALALVGKNGVLWACMLLVAQRLGKAIKKPAKDTLLSFAATKEGVGKSFAIQEMLDQIGAFLGPLMLYFVMLFQTEGQTLEVYRKCFAFLAIPAVITLVLLFFTKGKFPHPEHFEPEQSQTSHFKFHRHFVSYIAGISLFAFGFIDYSLIVMHVSRAFSEHNAELGNTFVPITHETIPLLYAGAMLVDAFAALVFGLLYDKKGVKVLMLSTAISAPFAIFIFSGNSVSMLLFGIALWGIGMGAEESILKAAVSSMVTKNNRATGYGIFEFFFGISWFLGSFLLGALYDVSMPAMIAVSVATQLAAIPFFWRAAQSV